MSHQSLVVRLLLGLFFLLPVIGCGRNDQPDDQTTLGTVTALTIDSVQTAVAADSIVESAKATGATDNLVVFDVAVNGCMCDEYDYFLIRWSEFDAPLINVDSLIEVLWFGDTQGLLLCDCSKGRGEGLKSVIKEINRLEDEPGLRINLVRKVYLDGDEVIPKVKRLFSDFRSDIVGEARFRVY